MLKGEEQIRAYRRERSCGRKKKFKLKEALRVGAKFNQYHYFCIHCCGYHLTKMRQKVRR